ncbi:MAG: hypothetical protein PHQ32_04550 [Firmicutes bacterium]|nr:hypothetical protein [Bacillota bacterium]
MLELVREFPNDIIFNKSGPCISLYQLTHRHAPENKQDIVQFNNTIKSIENQLKEKYKEVEVENILIPFYALRDDKDFWNKTLDGICILANEEKCILYVFSEKVENKFKVDDIFHIIPLIKIFGSNDKYNLLGINGNEFNIYEGNKYGLEELVLGEDIPRTIDEVLGSEHTEKYLNHDGGHGSSGNVTFHGQGSKKDDVKEDLHRYFDYIDELVFENYSKVSKLPLILVSLPENQGIFRKVSKNQYLLEEGIKNSFDSDDIGKLTDLAWGIMAGINDKKINQLVADFNQAKAKDLGSDEFHKIKKATLDNRIKIMMIEEDKLVTEEIDSVVEMVLKEKGEIVVLAKDQMPSETGIAAIYRY